MYKAVARLEGGGGGGGQTPTLTSDGHSHMQITG